MRIAAIMLKVIVPLLVITTIGVALVPLAPIPVPDARSGDIGFRPFMEPRLAALLESAELVEGLVSEQSRNVLALRAESTRITTLVDAIDAYLAETTIPAWAVPVVEDYRAGSDAILAAIEMAHAAIRTFDFSNMPDAIPIFASGTDDLADALNTLQSSGVQEIVVH